jgi:hypothetical protein
MLIVSLSTIPSRITSLDSIITNMIGQTMLPDRILINICKVYKRFPDCKIDYEYLESLANKYSVVEVNTLDHDYGPITKIYGALLYTENSNDIIITVDDDIIYPLNLVETFYNYFTKSGGRVVYGLSALNFVGTNGLVKRSKKHMRAFNILEGFGGVIYSRGMFSNDFIEYINLEDEFCFRSDDLITHNYLNKYKIPKRLICDDNLNISHIKSINLADGLCDWGTKNIIRQAVLYLKHKNLFYF